MSIRSYSVYGFIVALGLVMAESSSALPEPEMSYSSNVLFESRKLTAGDGSALTRFGSAVSVSGEHAIVGAHEACSASGAAYFFQYTQGGWAEVSRVESGMIGDTFGSAVAIDGNIAVVGAPTAGIGVAYVYQLTHEGWGKVATLFPSDPPSNGFGSAVSISGNRILVGARYDDDAGIIAGSAYIFEYADGAWEETAKLIPGDAEQQKVFGLTLDLSGDTAIIASRGELGMYQGATYIFEYGDNGWVEVAGFSGKSSCEYFGQSVAVSGDYAVIGSI